MFLWSRRKARRRVRAPRSIRLAGQAALHRDVALAEAVEDFRLACLSRAVDDREITLNKQSRAFFHISGAGHEALLLGLARNLRAGHDWFFPYYRDRALVLALGVTPYEMLLGSVGSAADPASGGRQMPSHWSDPARHLVTQSSPTGSQCLPAIGCAEAGRYLARRTLPGCTSRPDEITYVSLGEGATSEGEFWESLNTACRLALPVLYVIADNGYAISVRSDEQSPAPISTLVSGFPGLHVDRFDGCDYFEARTRGAAAIAHVRSGAGPALVHATVTRPYSHSLSDDQKKYRTREDLDVDAARDPLERWKAELVAARALTAAAADEIRTQAVELAAEAARQALEAPRPDPAGVREHLVAPRSVTELPEAPAVPEGAEAVTMGEAIRRTLHEEMARDERIRVFGQDVADAHPESVGDVPGKGGVFGITYGLQRVHGQERCFNAPLAEANIVGRAIGQAMRGLRPSPEIQFFDYIWTAMQQLRSEAATVRWRSNGGYACPMVLRVPIGGYLNGGAIWHSQSGESIFAHIPGLSVVMPSRARDAAGLLRTAFRCEDPVLFLEHKHLYRQGYARDALPPADWMLPFGRGTHVATGAAATIVTWGATVRRAMVAAAEVAPEGGVDVIDLRTLAPWDRDIVADSVARTGRVLVLHEDTLTCGFGAEIAAWIADECFEDLDAPVFRLGALDVPVPYEPSLEAAVLPQAADVARDLRHLLAY